MEYLSIKVRRTEVKLKRIVTTVAAAGIVLAGSAYADTASMQKQLDQLQAKVNAMSNSAGPQTGSRSHAFVNTNSKYTYDMLNNQDSTNRELTILQHRANGSVKSNAVYLGGKGELYSDYQRVGSNNSTKLHLPSANLIFTGTAGKWVTGYLNLQASNPVTVIGSAQSQTTSSVFLNDAYMVFGNLNASSFYGFGGIKTVDFGNFYNPNTIMPTLSQAFFEAAGGQVGAGYYKDLTHGNTINATITALNGGGTSSYNTMTSNANNINDYAANATFHGQVTKDMSFHVGGGYINGTGFKSTDNGRVGAINANAGVMMGNPINNIKLNAETTWTTSGVHGLNVGSSFLSNAQNLYGGEYMIWGQNMSQAQAGTMFSGGGTVKAFNFNAAYTTNLIKYPTVLFANYDNVLQNSANRLYMVSAGGRMEAVHNVWVGASYALAGGKMDSAATDINTSNTVLADVTAYF